MTTLRELIEAAGGRIEHGRIAIFNVDAMLDFPVMLDARRYDNYEHVEGVRLGAINQTGRRPNGRVPVLFLEVTK